MIESTTHPPPETIPTAATRPATTLEAARDLLARLGIMPLPVPYRSKNPNRPGWEQERVTLQELAERFDGARLNVGGMWGEPSGGAVDVDLDCPQVKRTAAGLLPETGAVYGHAGSRRSHALYRCLDGTTPERTRRWKDVDGATIVELRSTGGHSLMPGSVHPDGHRYEWDTPGEPAAVDGRELGRLVATSAAAALLARHWPAEGGRHDAAGALAGALARQGWPDAAVLRFVVAVLEASGDDEADDRLRFAAETLQNGRAGRQTTGWPSLAQAVPAAVVTRARGWLGAAPGGLEGVVTPGPERRNGHAPAPALAREEDAAAPVAPKTLAEVLAVFQKWLHLPDVGVVEVLLGTIAANLLPGDPVWLMLVAGSGWGKTELLQPLRRLPYVHLAGTVSKPALLSGTSKKEKAAGAKGGLLREIGDFGILVLKDFTSVLSMHREERAEAMAALREIYDGSWSRPLGVDGGRTLSWEGKLGIVAGCTSTIDSHHAVIGTMGERFVFYRLTKAEDEALAERALDHVGQEAVMRRELGAAVAGLFAGWAAPAPAPQLTLEARRRVVGLAVLTARCRSAVERDAHSRDIELIPEPEAPTRLALVFTRVFLGMRSLGVPPAEAWRVLRKLGADCVPALRWRAIEQLAASAAPVSTADVAARARYPSTTARRALEDLEAHQVVTCLHGGEGRPNQWELTAFARKYYRGLEPTFPEKSEGVVGTHTHTSVPHTVQDDIPGKVPAPAPQQEAAGA